MYQIATPRLGVGNFLAKIRAGQPVTVAYFGGSITAQGDDRTAKGGTVELAAGVWAKVSALVVVGETLGAGVYGGPQSAAPNKLDCFSGTGVIRVGEVGLKVIVAGVPG